MTLPAHPPRTYVALYGSHAGDWRQRCIERLEAAGVPWHDPSDPSWQGITHDNGDRLQDLVDRLVEEEQRGLLEAGAVVFHLAGGPDPPASLASRVELGLLAGREIPTFVHVDPEALGRNYVWATLRLHSHLARCESLEEAVDGAVESLRGRALSR